MQRRLWFGTATATFGYDFIAVKLHGQHHAQHRGTAIIESQLSQPRWGTNSTVLSSPLIEAFATLSLLLAGFVWVKLNWASTYIDIIIV